MIVSSRGERKMTAQDRIDNFIDQHRRERVEKAVKL